MIQPRVHGADCHKPHHTLCGIDWRKNASEVTGSAPHVTCGTCLNAAAAADAEAEAGAAEEAREWAEGEAALAELAGNPEAHDDDR